LKLREIVVGLVVGALAIGIFVGAVYVMAPGSSAGGEGSSPTGQSTGPVADQEPDAGETPEQ
jgi:hypothetical protein